MRTVRRLGYPLRLAARRLAARAPSTLLVAAGVAAGAAMLATVLAGTVVARDESVGRAVEEIPAAQRAVRAGWFGLPGQAAEGYPSLDRRARSGLAGVVAAQPTPLVLFRESTIAGHFVGLGAVDGLADWVTLRSGRLPRACTASRCEVVRLRGEGRLPDAPGLRVVAVGEATLTSPILFGDFIAPTENERGRAALSPLYRDAAAYHRPPPAPLVLAEGVAALAASPQLASTYRSYAWVVPLEPRTVRAWEVDELAGDVARARSTLQGGSSPFDVAAPVEELRSAAEASEVSGRRLLLVGGESAALLFAFAVLAAVSMRRDVAAARRRLTWFGAERWQLSLFTATEAAAVALAGTAAGWALGTGAGALVASRADAPSGEVLAHSTLSASGLLAAAAVAVALTLVLVAALLARPVALGRRSFSALDAGALAALAVVALTLLRGDLDGETLARESGSAVALVLLPGLVTFVAAVVCARLLQPALRGIERLSRGRSLALRLAALSLARHPGHAAVAAAFLLVSVGLAVFAESYRSTLARGQEQQAAYAVPLDFTLEQDLSRLIPVREAASPRALDRLGGDVRIEPVLRLGGNVSRAGGRTGIDVLGLDPDSIEALPGWRDDFSPLAPAEIAARLRPQASAAMRGPRLPADATALEARARGPGATLTASVETAAGDYRQLVLGEPDREGATLTAPVPPEARGGRVVALTLVPPRIAERGADTGDPFEGTLALGALEAVTAAGTVPLGSYAGWLGENGVEASPGGAGATLRFTLGEHVASRFRPRQPSDEGPVPVVASPSVAAAAGRGEELPLRVAGEQVVVRVAAVAERFPGTSGDFVVADRALLGTALNTERPGIAVADELWLAAGSPAAHERLAAALAHPPFDVLAVESRAALASSLRHDPLARGTLLTLLAGALVALALALVGVLLGVLADIRDERGELDDLEAQGARPSLLRRVVRLRSALVVAVGVAGGLATAAVLGALVVDLVAVTADAGTTDLPLRPDVSWPLLAAAVGAGALAAAALVGAASRRV
ncbi:MAG TPA: FtsX-like permease family protein [Gaiellaceae bacterium]|nr:FtsX-like permease family protein [Gaiellaceae bacterium]